MCLRPYFLAALLTICGAAHADTITTFNLTGSLTDNLSFTTQLSGFVTIDTTTGVVTAADAKFQGPSTAYDINNFSFASSTSLGYELSLRDSGGDQLNLYLANTPSLVGFSGASLCTEAGGATPCTASNSGVQTEFDARFTGLSLYATSGALLPPAVAATPEPSGIALLGTGALGLVGLIRRRRNTE